MIKTEVVEINGEKFMHTFSDTYVMEQIQTGKMYIDALDRIPNIYTYKETAEKLQAEEVNE